MIENCKKIFEKNREIIMYLIMGVATTVVNWVTYAVFIRVLSDCSHKVFYSNTLAWIFGVVFAYITNKIWVFESHNWELSFIFKEAGLFLSARIITGLLEIVGVPFLVDTLGFKMPLFGTEGMMAKVLVSVIVTILNYVFSKLIVFKGKKEVAEQES